MDLYYSNYGTSDLRSDIPGIRPFFSEKNISAKADIYIIMCLWYELLLI